MRQELGCVTGWQGSGTVVAAVCRLLGQALVTGGPRTFESCRTCWAPSVLGRWRSHTPVCLRPGWLQQVRGEVGWSSESGLRCQASSWTFSFIDMTRVGPGFLTLLPLISFHPCFAESLGRSGFLWKLPRHVLSPFVPPAVPPWAAHGRPGASLCKRRLFVQPGRVKASCVGGRRGVPQKEPELERARLPPALPCTQQCGVRKALNAALCASVSL